MAMLACCVIYIVYHIAHMHGTMVFARALLCLGRCLMATQHALSGPYVKRFIPEIASYKTDRRTRQTDFIPSTADVEGIK